MKIHSQKFDLNFEHEFYELQKGEPKHLYLLLHGYLLDGKFILEQLKDCFPENSLIIAPNGPFPVPVKKKEQYHVKYAWYFFDPLTRNYYVNFEPAADFLKQLLAHFPTLPTTVVGYSQGGYLAPKVAEIVEQVERVVGLCCTFRNNRFETRKIPYYQINSQIDAIVDIDNSIEEFSKISDNSGEFIMLPNAGHRIEDAHREELTKLLKRISPV